jgi:hypothetical protein
VLVRRQPERQECDDDERRIARDVLEFERGAVNCPADAGLPQRRSEDRADDRDKQRQVDEAADADRDVAIRGGCLASCKPGIDRPEACQQQRRRNQGLPP